MRPAAAPGRSGVQLVGQQCVAVVRGPGIGLQQGVRRQRRRPAHGGLGASGLISTASPPGFADPAAPTAAELRKRAIYTNYRALVDVSPNGGYGTLYGPNVTVNGNPTPGEGKIAGEEWLAHYDEGARGGHHSES